MTRGKLRAARSATSTLLSSGFISEDESASVIARIDTAQHQFNAELHARPIVVDAELRSRFDALYVRDQVTGCWLWTGPLGSGGYGVLYISQKERSIKAHRISWTAYHGADPRELDVLHKCDTPLCVNPDHLFLGDQADNARDMIQKGRGAVAERSGRAKLSNDEAKQILLDPRRHSDIAASFGISKGVVGAIKTGRTWRTVSRGLRDQRGQARGERHPNAKLTEAQVRDILNDARSQPQIATAYGVSPSAISLIKTRKKWGWVNAEHSD